MADNTPASLEVPGSLPDFSLLGGPLVRLGNRLGLIRGRTNLAPLGLALGATLWIVPISLTFIDGISHQAFSLSVVSVHMRLLVTIPFSSYAKGGWIPILPNSSG